MSDPLVSFQMPDGPEPGTSTPDRPAPESEDFEARLSSAVERVDELRPELEELRRELVDATIRWVTEWWEAEVRRAITADPYTVIDRLGEDGISRLKERVRTLQDRAPEVVRERLAISDLWVHRAKLDELIRLSRRGPEAFERPYQLKGRGVQPVEEVLRRLAGELGPVLVEAGLDRWHQGGGVSGGPWRRPSDQEGVRYMRPLDFPHHLDRAMNAYARRAVVLYDAASDVEELRRSQATAEAVRLWEQA